MRLIGIHGGMGAGKDTGFDIIDKFCLENDVLAMRNAFADSLKISALRSLGFVDQEKDTLLFIAECIKKTGRVTVTWEYPRGSDEVVSVGNGLNSDTITGREFWQYYGTEAHRAEDLGHSFGSDFWIDNLLPLGTEEVSVINDGALPGDGLDKGVAERPIWYHNFKEGWAGFADLAVVTDVRFENEAQRILDLGGEVWKIDSSLREYDNDRGPAHSSERPLPDQYITRVINNNNSLEVYENAIIDALLEGWGWEI